MPAAEDSVGGTRRSSGGRPRGRPTASPHPAARDATGIRGPTDANEVSASLGDLGKDFQAKGEA